MKKVLVLGAGRVARPCVQYLLRFEDTHVVVADLAEENIRRVTQGHPRSEAQVIPKGDDAARLVDSVRPDLVICLLPPAFVAPVVEACVRTKTHMIHPAYLDDATKAMADDIARSGALCIAELGLDPGIDHMLAARTISTIHKNGGLVESFRSVCGAIPSAEANTNPWGYKLSWAPDSLIGASKRGARVMLQGQIHEWLAGETYEHVHLEEIDDLGCFEVYANADSLPYIETYGIPETKSIYRGTIRYPGWCETICMMNALGLVEEEKRDLSGKTFSDFMAEQAGASSREDAEGAVCRKTGLKSYSAVMLRFKWLGFFEEIPIPFDKGSPRDVTAFLFDKRLVYKDNEKDLVLLRDEYQAFYPENGRRLKHFSTLVDFGVPGGDTSVARTTGLPPAIAGRLVLEGKIVMPGLHIPVLPEIYEPVLAQLEQEGITIEERMEEVG